jgi:membrane dipeptidase
MSSNYYTETDPLLPNDKGAPEIQGSRPQSINNDYLYVIEEQDPGDENQPRRESLGEGLSEGLRSFAPMIFIFFFFILIFVTIFPDDSLGDLFGDKRPTPKTLDGRVTRILEDTPLIGMYQTALERILLTYHRRS